LAQISDLLLTTLAAKETGRWQLMSMTETSVLLMLAGKRQISVITFTAEATTFTF
jgi:hypothetical protein